MELSLFNSALTIFGKLNKADADVQRLLAYLNTDIPHEKRRALDCGLQPNSKLDALSLIEKYRKKTIALIMGPKEKQEIACNRVHFILDDTVAWFTEIVENNRVSEMQPLVSAALVDCNQKIENPNCIGIYFDDGVSALGLLSKISEKLTDFLYALSVCDREYWIEEKKFVPRKN